MPRHGRKCPISARTSTISSNNAGSRTAVRVLAVVRAQLSSSRIHCRRFGQRRCPRVVIAAFVREVPSLQDIPGGRACASPPCDTRGRGRCRAAGGETAIIRIIPANPRPAILQGQGRPTSDDLRPRAVARPYCDRCSMPRYELRSGRNPPPRCLENTRVRHAPRASPVPCYASCDAFPINWIWSRTQYY